MDVRTAIVSALDSFADSIRSNANLRGAFFDVAVNAREQELRVQDSFRDAISVMLGNTFRVEPEYPVPGTSGKWDIAVLNSQEVIGVVEIKAPMTNQDGIRHKIRRVSQDVDKLRVARRDGAEAIQMFAIFEVYGVSSDGDPEPASGRSIRQYEEDIGRDYGIKWPTRHDYSPREGRQEVEDACSGHGLRLMSPWQRISLSPGTSNIAAYIDCGVFILE